MPLRFPSSTQENSSLVARPLLDEAQPSRRGLVSSDCETSDVSSIRRHKNDVFTTGHSGGIADENGTVLNDDFTASVTGNADYKNSYDSNGQNIANTSFCDGVTNDESSRDIPNSASHNNSAIREDDRAGPCASHRTFPSDKTSGETVSTASVSARGVTSGDADSVISGRTESMIARQSVSRSASDDEETKSKICDSFTLHVPDEACGQGISGIPEHGIDNDRAKPASSTATVYNNTTTCPSHTIEYSASLTTVGTTSVPVVLSIPGPILGSDPTAEPLGDVRSALDRAEEGEEQEKSKKAERASLLDEEAVNGWQIIEKRDSICTTGSHSTDFPNMDNRITTEIKINTCDDLENMGGDGQRGVRNLDGNALIISRSCRKKISKNGGQGRRASALESKSPDVDGGWAWVVFVAAFLAFFVSSGMYYSFSVFFVQLLLEFGESRAHTAWVYSTNSAVHMFSGPIGGWVITRWGPRCAVMLGGVFACVGYALSSMATNLSVLFVTFGFINAVGTSLHYSGWVVGLARFFKRRHALAVGIAMSGSGVGVFFMGPLINTLVEEVGWRSAMLLNAGFSLNFCVFGATIYSRLRKNPRTCDSSPASIATATPLASVMEELLVGEQGRGEKTDDVIGEELSNRDSGVSVDLEEEKRSLSSVGSKSGTKTEDYFEDTPLPSVIAVGSVWSLPVQDVTRRRPWVVKMRERVRGKKETRESSSYDDPEVKGKAETKREIYCSPPFWLLQASCFLSFMAVITMSAILKDWTCFSGLDDAFSMSLSATGLGDLLGRILAGLVAMQANKRGTSPLYLFGAVQFFLATSVFAASLSSTPEQLVAAMGATGVGCGLQSVLYALIPSYLAPPSALAKVLGYLLLVTGVGALTGPPLAGVLVDMTGSYDPVLGFCAVGPLLAAGLSIAAECSRPG